MIKLKILLLSLSMALLVAGPWAASYAWFSREEALAQQEVEQINASLYAKLKIKHRSQPVQTPSSQPFYTPEDTGGPSLWPVLTAHFALGDYSNRPEVRHEIMFFLSRRGILNEMLRNSVPYIYYVYQQTQQRNMPAEFALLPLVESGYDPFAYSQAGATGLWQMMPGTASSFGLDINWWYDSRRDTIVSTQSALNFLCSLHDVLHNWLLAAAAYDVGSGAVQAAQQYNQRNYRDVNFWDLPLPQETRDYVPRLLALAEIIKNPQEYGVQLPTVPNRPYFAAVNLNFQIDLAEASHFSHVSVDTIHRLNPGLLRWATNSNGIYTLLVPYDKSEIFMKNLHAVAGKEHISWQYHEIRNRETLASIAKNYHTTVDLLAQVNDLSSETLTPNQGLLVPLYLHRTYASPVMTGVQVSPMTSSANPKDNDSLKMLLGKIYSQSND